MIFCFSGTGNSLYAAQLIAEYNKDRIISISEEMMRDQSHYEYEPEEHEAIGFVYPVYAWAPPGMVLDFISRLSLKNAEGCYVYSVATCGDNTGNATKALGKALGARGIELQSGFSVVMPNNYIIIGDVDSHETAERKLNEAEERLRDISRIIGDQKRGIFQLRKGPVPWAFTGLITPLFNKYALDASRFYATDACTGCGLCEEVCPTGNIHVEDKPTWDSHCTQCLACIHRCPVRAIEYGKYTIKKGRYVNPHAFK